MPVHESSRSMGPTATAPAGHLLERVHPNIEDFDLDDIFSKLESTSHLERDRALKAFKHHLHVSNETLLEDIVPRLINFLSPDNAWEPIHAAATASQYVLQQGNLLPKGHPFVASLQQCCANLIKHPEARVRESVSALIGSLAVVDGLSTWRALLPGLMSNATDNFSLDEKQRMKEAVRIAGRDLDSSAASAKKAHQLLHETEGWRGLETSLLAMASLLHGCGTSYLADIAEQPDALSGADTELRDVMRCITRARPHPNRFVREAGLKLYNSVAVAAIRAATTAATSKGKSAEPTTRLDELVKRIARDGLPSLQAGLQDNWSQVRFSASVAARTVLSGVDVTTRHELYPRLLARMCLNRHYVAEGVRNYSQATWRTVVAGEGRVWLNRLLEDVIAFYDTQTEADNHAVREAACQALGEAALKLEPNRVSPLVGQIVAGLLRCFKDESWPVRDHACCALANVIEAYPTEVQSVGVLEEIFDLFKRHLGDNIPSVRENCAGSLVKACLAYEDEHVIMGLQRLRGELIDSLKGIEKQKESGSGDKSAKTKDTQYGASTKLAHEHRHDAASHHHHDDEEDAAHTNQVMYSCGSLAPKLRRGGGCMDHGFVREKEAWEVADGAVQAVRACMRGGARGKAACEGMGDELGQCMVAGWAKSFRGRGRFVESVLRGLNDVLTNGGKVAGGEEFHAVMRVVLEAERDIRGVGADALKTAAKEWRRAAYRAIGLGAVNAMERSVRDELVAELEQK